MDKTGEGYNRSPKLKQKRAKWLGSLLDFERPPEGFAIDFDGLTTYLDKYGDESSERDESRENEPNEDAVATAHMPRTEALYQHPLVIVPQAPGDEPLSSKAFLSWGRPIAFSKSFYGYSCEGYPSAESLAALIYLIVHSELFRYFALMTSGSVGADRMRFIKGDVDTFPFPEVSELSAPERATIRELARRLEQEDDKPWAEMNAYLYRLYGLEDDAQTIRDTLFASAAYRRKGRDALARTNPQDRGLFHNELHEMLDPYFEVCGKSACVEDAPDQPDQWEQPWYFLVVTPVGRSPRINPALLRQAMEEANKRSASRIIVQIPGNGGLFIGLLNQRRWWTVTRATLCAQYIIRYHLNAFGLVESA